MADAVNENEELGQSFNVDDILRDLDKHYAENLRSPSNSGVLGNDIWSTNGGSDFLSYGPSNGWSTHESVYSNGYGDCAHVNGGTPYSDDFLLGSSSPGSEAGSGTDGWKYNTNGFEFTQSAMEGADRYAQALSQWNMSNGNVYHPFSGTAVIDSSEAVLNHSQDSPVDHVIPESPVSSASHQRVSKSRPTFAEIAKNNMSSPTQEGQQATLSREGSVYESQESISSFYSKKAKPRAFRPAHPRYDGCHIPVPIQPDSKYGLDDFEIPVSVFGTKMERSLSCNDALDKTRSFNQQSEMTTSKPNSSQAKVTEEKLTSANRSAHDKTDDNGDWFDPKRMFKSSASRGRSESDPYCEVADTLLNNNAARVTSSGKAQSQRSKAAYINNLHAGDCRSTKQTNADRAGGPVSNGTGVHVPFNGQAAANEAHDTLNGDKVRVPTVNVATSINGRYVSGSVQFGKMVFFEILKYVLPLVMFIIGFLVQCVYFVGHHICVLVAKSYTYLAIKVGLNSGIPADNVDLLENRVPFILGMDENITLPSTGEDAMKRLEQCKSKDAYSILGLRSDVTDEEIKRYYKRQAVLVHPDKNQQPGAEEAFKILGRAFELIGDADKRKLYDQKVKEEIVSEDVRRQFTDLLNSFHERMDEAAMWIQCTNCNEKHRRYSTNKPVANARKCARCQCFHPAKEGDIWAETTFLGFKWHFYSCMENQIYDVTSWVSCQPHMVDKFEPNGHTVRLRMGVTTNNTNTGRSNGSREADLENLLKNLFPQRKASPANMNGKSDWSTGSRNNSKKTKRRVKRRQ